MPFIETIKKHRYAVLLGVVLCVATILRFYHLNFQSLWYDELYTVNEADPSLSWETFFNFYYKDEHPPLFFMLERFMFSIFGYEEHIARILPAIFGVLCVAAIYYLGKELYNKKLGLIAAAIIAVNEFAIYYSQEARAYTLFCLFSMLSLLYFLRILKQHRSKDIILFGICTAVMLYTHYYSLIFIMCELALVLVFWMNEKEQKFKLLRSFFLGNVIALVLYLPGIRFMLAISAIKKYWTSMLPPTFAANYYADFFGAYRPIYPFLVLLPAIFYFYFFREISARKNIKTNPLLLTGVVISTILLLGFGIPYLRALLVTPMMQSRYFIFTIPLFILIHSYAIILIRNRPLAYGLLSAFIGITLYHFLIMRQYYTTNGKEDIRSLTSYIAKDGRNYPMIIEKSGWNQQFYLKKKGYKGTILKGDMNHTLDSIMYSTSDQYDLDTLWLEGGYTDHYPTEEKIKEFSNKYQKIKEQRYHDAWAELWVRRTVNN